MNLNNLHELIDRYEANYLSVVNGSKNQEIFKWRAVKHFREIWFSEDAQKLSFAELFNAARKESSNLIDNNRVSPTSGIVKLAEKDPQEVERLFKEVLFADDGGDIVLRHNHMEEFLEKTEQLRLKYFPQFWKYKQDRHAASCYLVFFSPEENYIYRYSDAETFAQYIEYGEDIGSGENFRLEKYYRLCDIIVEALKEHESLIDEYYRLLDETGYYRDDSLHILAFDLMYCSRTYNFYSGLTHKTKKESLRDSSLAEIREKEERERQERIDAIVSEINELKMKIDMYSEISLIGVQVTQKQIGTGTIISQDKNKITVDFNTCQKTYVINRKYSARPTFEDEDEIVDAFTEYDDCCEKLYKLKKKLESETK